MKYFISLILAIIFGVVANSTSSGAKTNGHYQGIIMVSIIVFFILVWLIGKIMNSNYVNEQKETIETNRKIKSDLSNYQETKNSFTYFSDKKLLELLTEYKNEKIENLERLALEEELVKRKLIESSDMHEKLFNIKRNL